MTEHDALSSRRFKENWDDAVSRLNAKDSEIKRCSACRLEFRRLSGFDAHMVGPIGNRRHYSAPEPKDRGWKQDSNGRWQMPPKNDRPNVFV